MKFFAVLLLLTLFLTGCETPSQTTESPKHNTNMTSDKMSKKEGSFSYVTYSPETLAEMEGQRFVLFFYADWCSTCQKWEQMIQESGTQLYDNVRIVKADYDTDTDLVAQYGIASQSTAAFIDEDGSVTQILADPSVEELNAFFETADSAKTDPEEEVIQEDIAETIQEKSDVSTEEQETTEEMDEEEMSDPVSSGAQYEAYSSELHDEWKSEPYALFFHADWCPTCQAWEKMIQDNIATLPESTRILKVDYDTNETLVRKYDIQSQSIVVFVTGAGNSTLKTIDPSLDEVIQFFE